MDTAFASTILIGLIAFGIILSANHFRQAQALRELRNQMETWAEMDLRIKREQRAREVQVTDPRRWLEEVASRALGEPVRIQSIEAPDSVELPLLKATDARLRKYLFTPLPRALLLARLRKPASRLNRMEVSPLGPQPARVSFHELSILHSGLFFDLEARQVWEQLTGSSMTGDRLWMYVVEAGKEVKSTGK